MKKRFLLLALLLLMITACTNNIDPDSMDKDTGYVLKSAGIDQDEYAQNLETLLDNNISINVRAEIYHVLGRLRNDQNLLRMSLDFYHRALESTEGEEKAILYETIASMEKSSYYYFRAAGEWKKCGNDFRSRINWMLGMKKNDLKLDFETNNIMVKILPVQEEINAVTIGNSAAILPENSLIVSQADRVTRDWLSLQYQEPFSKNILTTFSERLSYPENELREDIGWHEGGRIKELLAAGLSHKVAAGTIIAEKDGRWYAPNENGVFMFEVPIDKVLYPTTRFLREDLAVIMDTHGVNMIVEQALRYNAVAVIACCDHPGKVKAAEYLANKGIAVICNTDRFVPLLMGKRLNILGSPSFRVLDNGVVFGATPVVISTQEPIIVQNISGEMRGHVYYDTPSRYFSALQKAYSIKLNTTNVQISTFSQMDKVIKKAEEIESSVIAVRIFSINDYDKVKAWLENDNKRRVILFHSEPYPYGYLLAREFRGRAGFDDISPEFVR